MRVVLENPGAQPADVELVISDPDATVADLLSALGDEDSAPGVVIDGRFCHADLGLEEIGLYEGATVRADGPPHDVDAPASAALELRVVGGLDAGRRMPLRAGTTLTVGRDLDADLVLADVGVSRRHLEISVGTGGTVTVTDLESANGTWIEGRRVHEPTPLGAGEIFEVGDVALTVVSPAPALPFDAVREVRPDGTAAFNRPPRAARPGELPPLALPERPRPPEKPQFSVVSAVGPLVLGGAMVLVMHNILFALFMILSPVLTVGGYLEQRRRASRQSQGQGREHQKQVETFQADLAARRDDELVRLRTGLPDMADLLRRATAPEPSLWERRSADTDFLMLNGGLAKVPFEPELSNRDSRGAVDDQAEKALSRLQRLPPAPVQIDLCDGGVVGIVGDRQESLAVARALLCQAVVLHGPADLQVAVLADDGTVADWEFAKWLPHARDHLGGGSHRLVTASRLAADGLIANLRERREADPRTVLAVIDSAQLIEGRGAPGRLLLREGPRVSGIILAASAQRLPANCTTVIELSKGTAEAKLTRPQRGEFVDPVLVGGISRDTAVTCARAVARFEDADLELEGGNLPTDVELLPLLGLSELSAREMSQRWQETYLDNDLTCTFAVDRNGPFGIDLVRDGPHALIAGTTGAGKSEMLRSLVAALAARYSPARLNFVLIDYKGGSAFAKCADLPHTVGMVTDLDEQLGERALTSLEAELRHRERVLRGYAADDLTALNRMVAAGRAEPLPRLVVIIDEFATLASELPDFVASLVGIAQRGRSLGVHLLLATQRPSGAVNENIRANTNIRICLRVQTPQDSADVLDDRAAANISRIQPGRAYVRLGPGEIDPIQTALVTGPASVEDQAPVKVRTFALLSGADNAANDESGPERGMEETSLDVLVDAAQAAYGDAAPPRRPWLAPLAPEVPLEGLLAALTEGDEPGRVMGFAGDHGLTAPLALGDDPAAQAQYAAGWNLDAGNLLAIGIGGSGTTTALQTVALSLALTADPDGLHMYVMDFGAGELASLAELPHVGAVVGASERERQTRLVRMLRAEVVARRDSGRDGRPRIVLLLDGYAGFVSEHSDMSGDALREQFGRIWADGPEVGVHMAIAADRPGAIPNAMASLAQQRLLFAMADPTDYAQYGIRRNQLPRFNPGRAVMVASPPMVLQIARARSSITSVAEAVRERSALANPPRPVGTLPARVTVTELLGIEVNAPVSEGALWLPVAIEDGQLEPAGWTLYPGEHAMVSGPPRTGRTSILIALAQLCAALHPDIAIAAAGPSRSALLSVPGLWGRATTADELTELVATLRDNASGPAERRLLLIDDADSLDDRTMALAGLLTDRECGVSVVAGARPETFRMLGHWSVGLRGARNGLLMAPDVNLDGLPLGVVLPRRPAPPTRPGCGYLVIGGALGLAQAALPDSASSVG